MKDRTIKLYNFIKDFWYLIKLFGEVPPNNDPQYWNGMLAETSRLNKYLSADAEGRFVSDCIQAWNEYLDRRERENKRRNR